MSRYFDGSSYITQELVPQVGNGTIAGWLNVTTLPGATDRDIILTFHADGASEDFAVNDKNIFINSSGIIKARIYDGLSKTTATTTGILVDTWHHFAATFDGTNLKVWLDGVNESTLAAGTSYTGYSSPSYRFAGLPGALTDGETTRTRFIGKLAEWGIWQRPLDPGEIMGLAKGFAPTFYTRNLVSYVDMIDAVSDANLAPPAVVGTVQASHPSMIYPRGHRQKQFFVSAAAAVYSRYYYDLLPMHTGSPF